MLKLLKRPVFTEKATRLLEKYNQYVFDVDVNLTKPQIRRLVEKIFLVQVSNVNTHRLRRVKRSIGGVVGFRPKFKRAIVTLIKDEKIIFFLESLSHFFFFMSLRFFRSTSPGSRHAVLDSFKEITSQNPEKKLLISKRRVCGRNHRGVITCRHRGGGHKRFYRKIDFCRVYLDQVGIVQSIETDPNRNARIALVYYVSGKKSYVLAPKGIRVGQNIISGFRVPIEIGNSLPLWNIPLGTRVHNVEFQPGAGRQLARSAGSGVQLVARENGFATLRLPSGEVRLVPQVCWATIGQVGNVEARNKKIGKAGRISWLGWRPTVRGNVMNPIDHPHGGGEGRCPIGRTHPVTPTGKARLGEKTRRQKKFSDSLILR